MNNEIEKREAIELVETELGMSPGWLIGVGIVTLIVGLAAIIVPQIATLAVEVMVGAIFLAYGIIMGINAFQMRGKRQVGLRVIGALFYSLAGLALLFFPVAGMVSLTVIVGAFLVIAGADKISLAFLIKPSSNWGWLAFNGVLDIVLAIFIFLLLPQGAAWVLGLMVGISMLFNGIWLITAGTMAKKYEKEGITTEYHLTGNESYK